MKLANALSQRELQTRIHQLETRLYNNAQVQEGESPPRPQDHSRSWGGLRPAGGADRLHQPHPTAARWWMGSPVRPAGPADCRKGKLSILEELPGQRQRAGVPAARWAIRIRSTVDVRSMQKGGPDVQGVAGAG